MEKRKEKDQSHRICTDHTYLIELEEKRIGSIFQCHLGLQTFEIYGCMLEFFLTLLNIKQ